MLRKYARSCQARVNMVWFTVLPHHYRLSRYNWNRFIFVLSFSLFFFLSFRVLDPAASAKKQNANSVCHTKHQSPREFFFVVLANFHCACIVLNRNENWALGVGWHLKKTHFSDSVRWHCATWMHPVREIVDSAKATQSHQSDGAEKQSMTQISFSMFSFRNKIPSSIIPPSDSVRV